MKKSNEEKTLTRAEMEIMTILWDNGAAMSTHSIIERLPEPKPAYSTIATFLKILTNKGFIDHKKAEASSKTFLFFPLISRAEYTSQFMKEVKSTFFGNSFKSMLRFFAEREEIEDEELKEIMELIKK